MLYLVLRRSRLAVAISIALVMSVALEAPSRAQSSEPRRFGTDPALPRLPAPFLLPELSHPSFDAGMDWFVGRLTSDDPLRPVSVAAIARPFVEGSVLVPRRIFVGATYPVAWSLPPDGGLAPSEVGSPSGTRMLFGNLETHARVAFPLPTRLESGLTLGIVLPTATFDREHRATRSASEAVASLDPTNYVHFLPGRVALRPAGDLRILRGPFVFQARHGIDVLIDDAGIERAKVAGRLLAHVGYLARSYLELSIEASQVYFFSSDPKVTGDASAEKVFAEKYRVSDDRRAAFTIGPALRLSFRDADVGMAIVTNLNEPLSPAASSFLGLRLSIVGHVGASP